LIVPKNLAFQRRLQKAALNQNLGKQGILNRHHHLVAFRGTDPQGLWIFVAEALTAGATPCRLVEP